MFQTRSHINLPRFFALALFSFLIFSFGALSTPTKANAELQLCNTTSSRVGVSIGYKANNRWATEGWWNIAANSCEILLKGKLVARYYYIHAVDYDQGGEWSGKAMMCTDDKLFTIYGVDNCSKRGHKRTGFFEIDTKDEKNWTIRLR